MLTIRPEQPEDIPLIEELLITAFAFDAHSAQNEHAIVNQLREDGDLLVSLVADSSVQGVVGFLAFSPLSISDGTPGWMALGPIAVEPRFQRRGVGRRLMETGLKQIQDQGVAGCVVYGEPDFHSHFGFEPDPGLVLPGADPASFLTTRFSGATPSGTVQYAAAFPAER